MGWQFYQSGVQVKHLWGTLPQSTLPWMWCSAVVLGLLIFQVAVIHLRPFFLPEAVLVVLKNGGASLYSNGIWQRSMQLLITVLLTPLTEEAFFRGILMTRWATKTGSLW